MMDFEDCEMDWNELVKDIDALLLMPGEEGHHDNQGSHIHEYAKGRWCWQAVDGQYYDLPSTVMDTMCYVLPPTRDRLQRTLNKVKLSSFHCKEYLVNIGVPLFEHIYDTEYRMDTRASPMPFGNTSWLRGMLY